MRVALTMAVVLAAAVLLAACGGYGEQPGTEAETAAHGGEHAADPMAALPAEVRTAVTIAKAIESSPDEAEQILASHGMTEESFEQLMYDIAADPQLSKAYEAALGS